jgi:plasmid stabilization system protein ParE
MSNYVAERDPEAAERLALDIRESFRLLAERPLIGHTRPDLLRAPVRVGTVRQAYLVIYRDTIPIEIVRVLDGRRDLAALLES